MEYEIEINVTAGTLENAPAVATLELQKGSISGYVYFPFGCAKLVQIRIFDKSFQIAPKNHDAWLKGNGLAVPFADRYDMKSRPYTMKIHGSSPDASLDHIPLIHVSLLDPWVANPEDVLSGQLKGIKTRLDGMATTAEDFMTTFKKLLPGAKR